MSRDSLRSVFTPKYYSLFPFFEKNGENLIEAAEQLKILMKTNDPEIQKKITRRISELEINGGKITNDTCARLKTLFIIPFDREDISELVNKIDDVLELINSMARMVEQYKLTEIYPVYNEMAEIVYLASKEISSCLKHLKDISTYKNLIVKNCGNIRELGKRADEIFYSGILNLFIKQENAVSMTKKKNLMDNYMKCIQGTNAVAEVMRTIQIKVA